MTTSTIIPRRTIIVCRHCRWPWIPRLANPNACPHCLSTDWDSGIRLDPKVFKISVLKEGYFESLQHCAVQFGKFKCVPELEEVVRKGPTGERFFQSLRDKVVMA